MPPHLRRLLVSVEISSEFPEGASDQIKRAVSENASPSGKRSPERAAPTRFDFLRSISLPIHEKSSRGVRCPLSESPVPLPTTGAVANGSVGAGGETIQGLICTPVVP